MELYSFSSMAYLIEIYLFSESENRVGQVDFLLLFCCRTIERGTKIFGNPRERRILRGWVLPTSV